MAGLKNNYQFEFTDTLTTSSMTVRISNEKENGAVATFTDQYITVRSDDNSIVERMKGSAVAGVLTLTMRGLDQSDVDTEVLGLRKEWREGSKAFITYVASQHANINGNNSFGGTQTFNDVVVNGDFIAYGSLTVPVYADATTRDLAIPTPTNGMIIYNTAVGLFQKYQGGAWIDDTAGGSVPNASTIVAGKTQEAVQSDIDNLNDTGSTGARLFVTPSLAKQIQTDVENIINEGFGNLTEETFMLGESATLGSSMFVEDMVTVAQSTNVENIGNITANTRVSFPVLGSGVAGNTLDVLLKKFVSPSVNLSARIETDLNGNPSGTIFNANALITWDTARLTTSLARQYAAITDTDNITFTSTQASANARGYRIQAVSSTNLTGVTKSATSTATRAVLKTDAGATITTATFVSNDATFNTPLVAGTFYRIELDDNGASYTSHRLLGATFPQNRTAVNYISGSEAGSSAGASGTTAFNIDSITTTENFPTFPANITIPFGQKVHVVFYPGTYGTETINATNYFGIGYASINTTTRGYQQWNGTVWGGTVNGSDIVDTYNPAYTYNSTTSTETAYGYKIIALADVYVKTITKSGSCTATRAIIKDLSGTVIQTISFSGNVATLTTPYFLANGSEIRIEADNSGVTYTRHANTGTYGVLAGTNITVTGGSVFGYDITYISNIVSVTTATVVFPTSNMIYASSTAFTNLLLSKTDADFTYKLPNYGKVRIINTTSNVGSVPNVVYFGDYDGFVGMTPETDMYIANTPGMLSALQGTNPFLAGRSVTSTKLRVGGKTYTYKGSFSTINSSQSSTGTNTSSTYLATQNEFISYQISASSAGGASSGQCTLQYSLDGSTNRTTIYSEAQVNTSTSSTKTMCSFLKAGVYYRSTSVATTSGSASFVMLTSTLLGL